MRAEVTALVSFGVTQEDIAAYLDINPETLRKHYRRELDTGQIRGNASMARRLYKAAEDGSVPAMIFWLKVRAGWTERTEITATVEITERPAELTRAILGQSDHS
jgi:predicted transcriptional regulator